MFIGLIDEDNTKFPNLALMKISAYHKSKGDTVEWATIFNHYDILYKSKIFNYTIGDRTYYNANKIIVGGTGYNISDKLPDEIEYMTPDYSLYPYIDNKTAYGFLTRGCPNKCKWCIVPQKEGTIQPYMDVDDIAINGRTKLILMDNNILASEYGIKQIKKIIDKGYKVDFNQALDARLINERIAHLLSKVRWINNIRLGCDTQKQIYQCEKAMRAIDRHAGKNMHYLLYMIIDDDINECYKRLSHFRDNKKVRISAQPYRDFNKINQVPQWQKDMARWANRKEIYASCDFKDYMPRKGFICEEYFR